MPLISEQTISEETMVADNIMSSEENYSRINLAAYIKNKGRISEQDFTLFAAYFDEKKNKKKFLLKTMLIGIIQKLVEQSRLI